MQGSGSSAGRLTVWHDGIAGKVACVKRGKHGIEFSKKKRERALIQQYYEHILARIAADAQPTSQSESDDGQEDMEDDD